MRGITFAASLLLALSPGSLAAETFATPAQMENAAADLLQSTERLVTGIDFAFDHLATFISLSGAPDVLIHEELKDATARIDGIRSILVVGKDGKILWDTVSFPAPDVNLASRTYVRDALASTRMVMGEVAIGKTSGFPFVPVAGYKPAIGAVIVGIMDPRELQRPMEWCPEICGGAIITDTGTLVVISPVETRLSFEMIGDMLAAAAGGSNSGFLHESRENFAVDLAWQRSDKFPIYAVAFRHAAITTSGALD